MINLDHWQLSLRGAVVDNREAIQRLMRLALRKPKDLAVTRMMGGQRYLEDHFDY